MTPRRWSGATSFTALLLGFSLAGCGDSRTVEAYCQRSDERRSQISADLTASLTASEGQPDDMIAAIIGLSGTLQALGDYRVYIRSLAEVAPTDVQTDVEALADGIDELFEAAEEILSSPLKALGGGLFTSLTLSGPAGRVNQYTIDNCGHPL